jgi:NAD(P)-dependent dehydrogenase (short-subunit alcohol dehydrogenase family)
VPDGDAAALRGQVALVSGAGRGIGRAVAVGLAESGAAVGLLGRSRPALDAALRECADLGAKAVALPVDVTDPARAKAAVESVERDLGPVDLLVTNAGLRDAAATLPWETDPDDWWRVVETNLRGTYLLDRLVLPGMVARGHGRVLHVGSGMGQRPHPDWSGYSVSKAAVGRLTDTLAAALGGTGVTLLEVSPGLVRTDMTETMWGPPDEQPWNDVSRVVGVVRRFAAGDLDALHGRFVHAARDDVDALLAQADHLRAADARTLRLRTYGPEDPLA